MCSTIFVFQHSSTALFPEQCEGGWLLHPTFAALSLSETLRFGLFEAEARSLVVACQWAPMGAARTSWRWWHLQAPCTKQARWVVTLWQWRLALRPWRGWRTNPAVEYIHIYIYITCDMWCWCFLCNRLLGFATVCIMFQLDLFSWFRMASHKLWQMPDLRGARKLWVPGQDHRQTHQRHFGCCQGARPPGGFSAVIWWANFALKSHVVLPWLSLTWECEHADTWSRNLHKLTSEWDDDRFAEVTSAACSASSSARALWPVSRMPPRVTLRSLPSGIAWCCRRWGSVCIWSMAQYGRGNTRKPTTSFQGIDRFWGNF